LRRYVFTPLLKQDDILDARGYGYKPTPIVPVSRAVRLVRYCVRALQAAHVSSHF